MKSSFFNSLPLKKYIFSFIAAFVTTLILLSVVCIIFAFSPPAEWLLSAFYNYSGVFSSFLAALFCAYSCGRHGMLTGVFSADIYTILLFIIGNILFGGSYMLSKLVKDLILSTFCGAIGGIIGINCK